jgi:phosphoserine phosphatase RsbU/P
VLTIRNWSQLPRGVLVGLATIFAAATILYSALWMYVVRQPSTHVDLGFDGQYSAADHCFNVQIIEPGGPAERAGLRLSDHILAVDGRSLDSMEPFADAWFWGQPGDSVELTVKRPGQPGTSVLRGIFRPSRPETLPAGTARASALEVQDSFPVFFLVVGLTVLFLRLDDPNAWRLALLFGGFIAVPWVWSLAPLKPGLAMFARAYRATFVGMTGAFFYLFFAFFPIRSPLDRRLPWLKWVAFVLGVSVTVPGLRVGDVAAPEILVRMAGPSTASKIALTCIYLFTALGVISLLGNALGSYTPDARRKSRVILWGTVVGLVPGIIMKAAEDYAGYRPPFWLLTLLMLMVLLYPLSFAYAVVKHRVMEFPALLKRSARYVLVQRGYVVLIFLVAATAILLFTRTISRFFPTNTDVGMGLSAAFGILLVWASAPMVKRGTQHIDRAFFRSAYDARVILQDLAEKARTVTDRHELARLLELQITGALRPKSLACYLDAGDGRLVAEGVRAVPGSDANPNTPPRPLFPFRFGVHFFPREADEIPATLPLLNQLAERGRAWDVPPEGVDESGEYSPLSPECLVPILGRNSGLLGLLVLGPRLSEEPYSGEDKHLLDSVASQAGVALENMGLAEKMAERMEAERRNAVEMDIARRVQTRLFPQNLPPLQTMEYVGGCVQARQVGGDFYDFLDMGPGVLGLVLADISGKGISGALLMANLQANLRSQYAVALDDLPRLLKSVNRLFHDNTTDDSYATMFFGVYDDTTRKLRYANCGHIAPLILRVDGSVRRLTSTTTVLGLFLDWESPIEEVTLQPGDLVVICTDGVTEAPNREGEEYGETRLTEVIRKNGRAPVNGLLTAIQESVQEYSGRNQADDITLIVARCR